MTVPATFTTVTAQNFDWAKQGMGGQNCKMFSCTKDKAPVPKAREDFKFTSGGCDAMGGGALMLNKAESSQEKPFEKCCHEWHACYQICGTSKQACDEAFKSCSEEKCKGKGEDCTQQYQLISMMLQLGGCQSFESQQAAACKCVSKKDDKHLKKREEVLKMFYQKYAPDSIDKVPELAKKTDTAAKMAQLLRKLVAKYPESIVFVESEEAKKYKEMFENVNQKMKDEKKEDSDSETETEVLEEEEQDLDEPGDETDPDQYQEL